MNTIKTILPSGAKASLSVPEGLNTDIIALATKAFLGSLLVISEIPDEEIRNNFLVRFVSSMAALADNALRSSQMISVENTTNDKQAIEALLQSIRSESHKKE